MEMLMTGAHAQESEEIEHDERAVGSENDPTHSQKVFKAISKVFQPSQEVFQPSQEARRIFDELALNDSNLGMEKEVLESKFREKLASSGFKECDIDVIIKDMEKDGIVERIYTQLDGAICDILRWKSDNS